METQKVFIFFKDVCFQANQSITASAQLLKSISNLTELFLCLRGSRAPFIFLKLFTPSSQQVLPCQELQRENISTCSGEHEKIKISPRKG